MSLPVLDTTEAYDAFLARNSGKKSALLITMDGCGGCSRPEAHAPLLAWHDETEGEVASVSLNLCPHLTQLVKGTPSLLLLPSRGDPAVVAGGASLSRWGEYLRRLA